MNRLREKRRNTMMTLAPPTVPHTTPTPDGGELLAASRRLAHGVNNRLVVPMVVLELLQSEPGIPTRLRTLLTTATAELEALATDAREFQCQLPRSA